jgi:hypothetical protein
VKLQSHTFLISTLSGGEWSASRSGRFTPPEGASDIPWIGGWVGSSAGLDSVVKRRIPSPYRDSNPPIIRPVAQRCTTERFRLKVCVCLILLCSVRYYRCYDMPTEAGNFSLHHGVQKCSGAHPTSYPMDTRGFSLGVKRLGHVSDYSPPSSAEVKEWEEIYLHSSNTPLWRDAQLKEEQGQLYLHLYLYV